MWTVLGILVSCLFGRLSCYYENFELNSNEKSMRMSQPTYDSSHDEPTDEQRKKEPVG